MINQATDNATTTLFSGFDIHAVISQAQDESMLHIPMPFVEQVPDFNPRRYRDPVSFAEFKRDVKQNKVLQPIVVRPNANKDGFEIIAGHGRYEANAEAGHPTIPAIIRLVSEETALAISLAENIRREGMSPMEEAEAARRMLGLCDGDKDEAAAHCCWDRQFLERRLALLHCSSKVADALVMRKIKLGHAELLAGLSEEMQDNSLKVILERKTSVSEFKDVVNRYAYLIKDAIFDCTGCNGCPQNSSQTADLFDTSLGDGRCLNRTCYDQKTQEAIVAKAEALREEFPSVWLDSEKAPEDLAYLAREGATGIGKDQLNACKGCNHYGAIVSTAKGKEGEVTENVCFKVSCHRQMVKARQQQIKEKNSAQPVKLVGMPASTSVEQSNNQTSPAPAKRVNKKAKATEVPKRVIAYAESVHCKIATKAVMDSEKMVKIFALLALIKEYGHVNSASKSVIIPVFKKYKDQLPNLLDAPHNRAVLVEQLAALDDAALDELTTVFAAGVAGEKNENNSLYSGEYMKTVRATLKNTSTVIEDHWQINSDYLSNLTKPQIEMSMKNSGFIKWYESSNGEGSFKKDFSLKREDMITKIVETGYNWKGYIPNPLKIN